MADATQLAEALRWCARALDAEHPAAIKARQALAAFEAQAAEPVAVTVERERVWIKRGVQSFMLAYEADTDEERHWYANQLRGVLAAPVAQAEPAWLPIETAPPERGLYLVQIGEQTHVAQFDPRMASAKWWHPYGLPARLAQAPTHWMPLPQPPKEGT